MQFYPAAARHFQTRNQSAGQRGALLNRVIKAFRQEAPQFGPAWQSTDQLGQPIQRFLHGEKLARLGPIGPRGQGASAPGNIGLQ